MSIRRAFREMDADVPNVGSWSRRLATALEKTEGRGSWDRRAVVGVEEDLGPGSWKARLQAAIRRELLGSGGSAPELVGTTSAFGSNSVVPLPEDMMPGDLIYVLATGGSSTTSTVPVLVEAESLGHQQILGHGGSTATTSMLAGYFWVTEETPEEVTITTNGTGSSSISRRYLTAIRNADQTNPVQIQYGLVRSRFGASAALYSFARPTPFLQVMSANSREFITEDPSLEVSSEPLDVDTRFVNGSFAAWMAWEVGANEYGPEAICHGITGSSTSSTRFLRVASACFMPENEYTDYSYNIGSAVVSDNSSSHFFTTHYTAQTFNTAEVDGQAVLQMTSAFHTGYASAISRARPSSLHRQVLAEVRRINSTGISAIVWCLVNQSSNSNIDGYLVYADSSGNIRLGKLKSSSFTDTVVLRSDYNNTWYTTRVEYDGERVVAKAWYENEEEPEDWMGEIVDGEYQDDSWSYGFSSRSGSTQLRYLSVGYDGRDAPYYL